MGTSSVEAQPIEIAGYTLGERLGSGGFGDVFAARQDKIDRDVAIKILHAKYSADAEAIARFTAEARAIAKISHPGIVDVIDVGELADGRRYLIMERIRGRTLRDVLRERTRIPLAEALPMLRGIAAAVDAAHAVGIAHRDLKPDNVFVLDDGAIKLIDFGLAKITREAETSVTQSGSVFGTPLYMSPEQCRGKAIDTRTDLYSFGVLAYQMLVGEPPFSGDALQLALQHLNETATAPSKRCAELPARVDATVLALLAKDPVDRPQPLIECVDVMAGQRDAPRRRAPWTWIALAMLVVVGGIVWLAVRGPSTKPMAKVSRIVLPGSYEGSFKELSFDGASLFLADRNRIWSFDLGTSKLSKLPIESNQLTPLPGGKLAVVTGKPSTVEIVDLQSVSRRTAARDLAYISASPDGRSIVGSDSTGIVAVNLDTGARRTIWPDPGTPIARLPRCSPDFTKLIAFDRSDYTVRLVDVGTGETEILDWPFPLADRFAPAAFVDRDTIIYCHRVDNNHTSLRIRDIHGATAGVELENFGANTNHCSFTETHRGRVVVTIRRSVLVPGRIALDHSNQLDSYSDLARKRPAEIGADGETLYVRDAETLYIGGEAGPQLYAIPPGKAPVSLPRCGDDLAVVLRDERPLIVTLARDGSTDRLAFRDIETCVIVDQWSLPHDPKKLLSVRCRSGTCIAAHQEGEMFRVYRLGTASPSLLAEKHNVGFNVPTVAISSDGKRAIATVGEWMRPLLIDLERGSSTELDLSVQSVAWGGEPDHFLITGTTGTGGFYVSRVSLDGAKETLWSSSDTWVSGIVYAPRTNSFYAGLMTFVHETYLVSFPN